MTAICSVKADKTSTFQCLPIQCSILSRRVDEVVVSLLCKSGSVDSEDSFSIFDAKISMSIGSIKYLEHKTTVVIIVRHSPYKTCRTGLDKYRDNPRSVSWFCGTFRQTYIIKLENPAGTRQTPSLSA